MKKILVLILYSTLLIPLATGHTAEKADKEKTPITELTTPVQAEPKDKLEETAEMLNSLLELQQGLQEQIKLSKKELKSSSSDTEKSKLQEELQKLDRQLSDTNTDFERIATGVESALFVEKAPETFNWKEEIASLVEPAIKELKRLTIRARQRTHLKESINELDKLTATASAAVSHLEELLTVNQDKKVNKKLNTLLPEWKTILNRLERKRELAQMELNQLNQQDGSLVEHSRKSVRTFFKDRGRFLVISLLTFFLILLFCRLLYRFFFVYLPRKLHKGTEQRSFQVRLIDILFQATSFFLAICSAFLVLYLAEDWFLLSLTIIFIIGLTWTIRQGVPKLWQQGRLMLNIGSVRERERITFHGIPWRVDSINVFCKLTNPALNTTLRIPVEQLVGHSSRQYQPDEPWFPCKKGDWVVIGDAPRARVVSQSHELVELVERGGTRRVYTTENFLAGNPQNLSRNYRLRVVFGLSYALQSSITTTVPVILEEYINKRLEASEFGQSLINLRIEFMQANSSSLDILLLADFKGETADICKRIERSLNAWCVECATENDWEIPFPQLTIHEAAQKNV
ncbi:mechanosensitive ion channel family protein [Desulfogranum japonicum]|uniref:mechanosensitive ion channel family protein n=1 Tax=Desulfogranum japonicum TaxID=231447 RepID=UPI0003F56C8A|nr:mechanosensitive ion channel family protein [Desulfogranum japonicum]